MSTNTHAPGYGECPVCHGTEVRADGERCRNCGAQYMFGYPTGSSKLRPDGTPCTHSYAGETTGRGRTTYKCRHCGDTYAIDSF